MLLYSSRNFDDVIYREELAALPAADPGLRVIQTLTRSQPPGWTGYDRRIDRAMLAEAIDIRVPGVNTRVLRDTALRMQRGGVGFYPGSNFIHVDVGRVRQW